MATAPSSWTMPGEVRLGDEPANVISFDLEVPITTTMLPSGKGVTLDVAPILPTLAAKLREIADTIDKDE